MNYQPRSDPAPLGSLPIQAVDVKSRTIKQWPDLGVRTKNLKSATTYLLHIPELLKVVEEWDTFIRQQMPPTAMWYTPVVGHWGEQTLSPKPAEANRGVAIGKRVRKLYAEAGLPRKSPHKFRHGHAVWALQQAQAMADYKAISQNLMHGDIRITDSVYAPLLGSEVQQRITGLSGGARGPAGGPGDVLNGLSKTELADTLRALARRLDAAKA